MLETGKIAYRDYNSEPRYTDEVDKAFAVWVNGEDITWCER